jgi:hypothetical protein
MSNEAFGQWLEEHLRSQPYHPIRWQVCDIQKAYEAGQNQRDEEVKELKEEMQFRSETTQITVALLKRLHEDNLFPEEGQGFVNVLLKLNDSEARVNELKRKLFNEGVKNNSDKARVEFLEGKLEGQEQVIEAARGVCMWRYDNHVEKFPESKSTTDLLELRDAIRNLDKGRQE